MHEALKKKIVSLLLVLTCLTTYSTQESWYNKLASQYCLQCCIAGTAAALIIGKLSYSYYTSYQLTPDHVIDNCRLIYKTIYQDVEQFHFFYQNDVKTSDWELKEIILDNNKEAYPFMRYYKALTQTSWILHKHLLTLSTQLTEINKNLKQLPIRHSEEIAQQREMFINLKTEGKLLQQYIIKTVTLIKILQNKVKLFKEYNDDRHNWSQTKKNTYS